MEELFTVVIIFGSLAFIVGLGWLIAAITDSIYDLKAKKHRAKYPHLYELYGACDRLESQIHNIRREKYYTPKQKIDSLMKNARYFPKAKREEIYMELEKQRTIIANHYEEIRPLEDEVERIEQQIENYKILHKIKKVY